MNTARCYVSQYAVGAVSVLRLDQSRLFIGGVGVLQRDRVEQRSAVDHSCGGATCYLPSVELLRMAAAGRPAGRASPVPPPSGVDRTFPA